MKGGRSGHAEVVCRNRWCFAWTQDDGAALDGIIATGPGWERFRTLVATASALTNVLAADPLSRVLDGYHRFRLYAPRMLRLLDRQAAPIAKPLLAACAAAERDQGRSSDGFSTSQLEMASSSSR
jgi:hypothetical protein